MSGKSDLAAFVVHSQGSFTASPPAIAVPELSPGARSLVERAFIDLIGPPLDCHVHILGLGSGGSGAYANPRLLGWSHPFSRLKAEIIFKASGVTDHSQADRQYLDRLLALASGFPIPPRLAILAFAYRYTKDGTI